MTQALILVGLRREVAVRVMSLWMLVRFLARRGVTVVCALALLSLFVCVIHLKYLPQIVKVNFTSPWIVYLPACPPDLIDYTAPGERRLAHPVQFLEIIEHHLRSY